MKIKDILAMSWSSLLKRKVRTFLTVLGVVIGTISIVVMVSLGIGMKNMMLGSMEAYGSLTQVEVTESNFYYGDSSEKEDEVQHLNDDLIEQLMLIDHVEDVIPVVSISGFIKIGKYMAYAEFKGIEPEAFEKLGIEVAEGSIPTDTENLEFLYGNLIPAELYEEKNYNYVYYETGELADVDFMEDQVFAIFDMDRYFSGGQTDENGQITPHAKKYIVPASGMMAGDVDDYSENGYAIWCNIDALKSVLKKEFRGRTIPDQPTKKNGTAYKEIFYSTLYVCVDEMANVTEVQTAISDMGYSTYANAEWIEEEMSIINIVELVLGGIGAVSLFVAAIGITNTMMMSIYERTKEIGIMKVIGCRIRDIQLMFLAEAGFIGLIGGTIGLIFSYIISFVINRLAVSLDESMSGISSIPLWLAGVSLVFAILVGMVSGFFPSLRAMKLSPLSAIRSE